MSNTSHNCKVKKSWDVPYELRTQKMGGQKPIGFKYNRQDLKQDVQSSTTKNPDLVD